VGFLTLIWGKKNKSRVVLLQTSGIETARALSVSLALRSSPRPPPTARIDVTWTGFASADINRNFKTKE